MKQRTWRQLAAFTTLAALAAASLPATAGGVPSFKDSPAIKGDSNTCMGRDDGVYVHEDCRMYYICHKGGARQAACPEGQVFDQRQSPDGTPGPAVCAAPEKVRADCSSLTLAK